MNLTPREKDKLLIAMAAIVARRRLERGVKLNHPEAIALITDFVVEGAREGPDARGRGGGNARSSTSIATRTATAPQRSHGSNRRTAVRRSFRSTAVPGVIAIRRIPYWRGANHHKGPWAASSASPKVSLNRSEASAQSTLRSN